jgi:hypothetical protein
LQRLLAYFALAAAVAAAYLTVPVWGLVLVCVTSVGFVALNEPLRRNPSRQVITRAVLATYFLTGATAIGTLVAGLPPPAFWVVSSVLPAWQARRLLDRKKLDDASRMLQVGFAVYAWVLVVALWLPLLLVYR